MINILLCQSYAKSEEIIIDYPNNKLGLNNKKTI